MDGPLPVPMSLPLNHLPYIGQESIKTHHCESKVVVLLVGWLNICSYQYGPPYIMDAGTYGDVETGPHQFLTNKLALFQSWMGGLAMDFLGEYTHQIYLHSDDPDIYHFGHTKL